MFDKIQGIFFPFRMLYILHVIMFLYYCGFVAALQYDIIADGLREFHRTHWIIRST